MNKFEKQLIDDIGKMVYDPLLFVLYIFPWGQGKLKDQAGPDLWQQVVLRRLGKELLRQKNGEIGTIRIAIRSGHGVGKGALMAWINYFYMSTRRNCDGITTANTGDQLKQKTWRELAKWHDLAINSHWFERTATRFYMKQKPDLWSISATTWNQDKPQAFAGLHEENWIMIFDEASIIPDTIWEVAEGAMTTPGLWVVAGNPTQASGRFSDCFKKYKHRWITYEVDSRTAKMTDQEQIQQWADDYGEDSDFFKVRVLGKEPSVGTFQLIGSALTESAVGLKLDPDLYSDAPKVVGVDVARFGDDSSILVRRQGLKCEKLIKFNKIDTMELTAKILHHGKEYGADGVLIDVIGIGAGVVDRARQLNHDVIEVNFAQKAVNDMIFKNKRAESYWKVKEWLERGGSIPADDDLIRQLSVIEYSHDGNDRILIETKNDIKKRIGKSPDEADALAISFAEDIVASAKNITFEQYLHQKPRITAMNDAWMAA